MPRRDLRGDKISVRSEADAFVPLYLRTFVETARSANDAADKHLCASARSGMLGWELLISAGQIVSMMPGWKFDGCAAGASGKRLHSIGLLVNTHARQGDLCYLYERS
jgi:hypothetical protein